jgi:hypothetical protein
VAFFSDVGAAPALWLDLFLPPVSRSISEMRLWE